MNAIQVDDSRYFKPYRRAFQRVTDRPLAWRIKAGSYFLLPYREVFGSDFPHDFTIFLTFKPYKETEVTLFRTRSRPKIRTSILPRTYFTIYERDWPELQLREKQSSEVIK